MALRGDIDDLVNGLDEAESGVEAATWDGSGGVDHGEKGKSDGGSLEDTVLGLACLVVDLADDALAEEEGAPELKEEDLAKTVKVNTTTLLIIGAQEGGLAHTEVSINDTKEATDDLGNDDHADERGFAEELALGSVNGKSDCRIEHTSWDLAGHEDTHEEVEADGETGSGEVVTQDEHSCAEELIEANNQVVSVNTWSLNQITLSFKSLWHICLCLLKVEAFLLKIIFQILLNSL